MAARIKQKCRECWPGLLAHQSPPEEASLLYVVVDGGVGYRWHDDGIWRGLWILGGPRYTWPAKDRKGRRIFTVDVTLIK